MIKTAKKYFYHNGFSLRSYICTKCGSHKLVAVPMGGFSPSQYDCEDCHERVLSPKWENATESDKEYIYLDLNEDVKFKVTAEKLYDLIEKQLVVYGEGSGLFLFEDLDEIKIQLSVEKFDIEVCRISYGFRTINVEAQSQEEAERIALDEAGNHEFSEKSSEYKIS